MSIHRLTEKKGGEFNKEFNKLILELGAKVIRELNDRITYELETIVGRLEIYLHPQSTCYTVFTCFDDPKLAATKTFCNSHSGKCNQFISANIKAKEAATLCVSNIALVVKK